MPGALDGIRILDLTEEIAGPVGVLYLAELGADVVKVEPLGGDPSRAQPGSAVWHRSRRSIVLDLSAPDDRNELLGLVDGADVLVESFAPGTMDGWNLGAGVLAGRNARLVHCSVPAYPRGHRAAGRPGIDALVQARSGQQSEQPGWRPGPVHLHFSAPSMGASFLVAVGVLAALVDRERTGVGQRVETSLYQGVLAFTTQIWQEHERPSPGLRSTMSKSYPPGVHQASIFECRDGAWIHAATMSGGVPTRTLEEILGLDAVDGLALMADPEARVRHTAAIRVAILGRDRDELVAELHAAGLGAEPIVPMEDAFDHPQMIANDMTATVVDHELGSTTQVGTSIHLSATPGAIRGPRPLVGAHTDEVLAERRATPTTTTATANPDPGGPLAGLTVLDLGQFLAGPFASMILADFGATVIKVEPVRGDPMRNVPMPFAGCQRSKAGLAVDLRSPEGVEVVLRLAEQADVVHHNMTKGTAARLGVGYAALSARNPALVHCNTYAYGPEGPMSGFGGLDPLYQAACGLEYAAGAVGEGNAPLYLRFGMTDTANGFLSVIGVLAALFHRARSGEGQDVWTSLLNGAAMLSSEVFRREAGDAPRRPGLDRGLHGTSPCLRLYATQDGWVQVAATAPDHWRSLCEVADPVQLADLVAVGYEERVARRAELEPRLQAVFLARTAVGWVDLLDEAGVPAEVVVDTVDGELAMYDADNERLGLVVDVEHPTLGRIRQFGALVSFSASPEPTYGPPPMWGQHTRAVLEAHGFAPTEVDELLDRGIVAEPDLEGYPWVI